MADFDTGFKAGTLENELALRTAKFFLEDSKEPLTERISNRLLDFLGEAHHLARLEDPSQKTDTLVLNLEMELASLKDHSVSLKSLILEEEDEKKKEVMMKALVSLIVTQVDITRFSDMTKLVGIILTTNLKRVPKEGRKALLLVQKQNKEKTHISHVQGITQDGDIINLCTIGTESTDKKPRMDGYKGFKKLGFGLISRSVTTIGYVV